MDPAALISSLGASAIIGFWFKPLGFTGIAAIGLFNLARLMA